MSFSLTSLRLLQVQAGGPQADPAATARGLRGPLLSDILAQAEPDLPGPRADVLPRETLAGPAQAHGPRLQVCACQRAAGEVRR